MVYGNKLVYAYDEEMSDGTKETKKLELTYNPITLIRYQGYTGRDMMADFMSINFNSAKKLSKELQDKIGKGKDISYDDITEADMQNFTANDLMAHTEFFINLAGSMLATTLYPKVPAFSDIINSLPLFLFYDENFLKELCDLIAFGLKKNKVQLSKEMAHIKLN